jgi:hypothetical protein
VSYLPPRGQLFDYYLYGPWEESSICRVIIEVLRAFLTPEQTFWKGDVHVE